MGGMQQSGTGTCFRAGGLQFKTKSGFQDSSIARGRTVPTRSCL
jgi:hypothetical protein